jgi:F0F1-type ATP synthase delta subunit
MTNKLKILAEQSYVDGELDEETVSFIADKLSRQELKQYIKFLKLNENKNRIIVTTPAELNKKEKELIEQKYVNKSVLYVIDPNMISGIRITDHDMEYEISLNQIFHDIINHLYTYDRQ